MADPRMMTTEDLAETRRVADACGDFTAAALFDHIAAQDAELAKLQACVRAGDSLIARFFENEREEDAGIYDIECSDCGRFWATGDEEEHEPDCSTQIYGTARAAVTLPEEANG